MIEQFLKFCLVGGSGVFVDFGITYLCKEWLRLNKYVANSLGFLCAATSNYVLNRLWTFGSTDPHVAVQYMRFLGISAVGLAINNLTIYVLHGRFRLNFYLAKLFAIGVVTFWNFFMNYFSTSDPRPGGGRLQNRRAGRSDLLPARIFRDCVSDYRRPRIRRSGRPRTPKKASPKMPPDIFEAPSRRSVKMIETSRSFMPSFQAVYFISIWNP